MATISSLQRVQNILEKIEESSDRKIGRELYFIVHCTGEIIHQTNSKKNTKSSKDREPELKDSENLSNISLNNTSQDKLKNLNQAKNIEIEENISHIRNNEQSEGYSESNEIKNIKLYVKNILKGSKELSKPNCAYIFLSKYKYILIFLYGAKCSKDDISVSEKQNKNLYEHIFNGSHHSICSYFVSQLSLRYKTKTECKIIEFEDIANIIMYFHNLVFSNYKYSLFEFGEGLFSKKECETYTEEELNEILKRKDKSTLNLEDSYKYGTFYKYQSEPSQTYQTLCELINLNETQNYEKYFFH